MPLQRSSSGPAFKANVRTLMGEVGKSKHVGSRDQALAIAYSIKRRGRYMGGRLNRAEGGEADYDPIIPPPPEQAAMDRYKQQMPSPQVRGPIQAIRDAFSLQRDENGIPRAPGVGDTINAALWAVPGMRGPRSGANSHAAVQPSMGADALLTAMRRSPGGLPEPQNIATSRRVQADELKSRWQKSGPVYDEADFMETPRGDKLWTKEVNAWNKEFGTNFDPNNMPIDASTQGIVDRYRAKYIGDQKAKFPGVAAANEHFEYQGEPQNAIYLRGKDELGNGESNWRLGRSGNANGGAIGTAYAIRRQNRADGGEVHAGPILSSVPGRTDNHPMDVSSGSYVLPADHISSLGEGNTAAGMEVVRHMLGGLGADGGSQLGEPVPINAAGGEFVIAPEVVMAIGGGDIKRGHEMLDQWVLLNRKKHISTLRGLPGPAKS